MRRNQIPFNALRTFEAAARRLSFTSAAEELAVTQSAVSHQIRALEVTLGVPLFRRLPRGLRLTDAGQRLLPVVRGAFDDLSAAMDRLRSVECGNTLTVSVMPSFAVKWLVPRISRFQADHPDIDLRISASERLADFSRDSIDVAVRFGDGTWPGLYCERLFGEQVTPMCAPAVAKGITRPADLAGVTLLHEEMLPLGRFPTWVSWLDAAGVRGVDPPAVRTSAIPISCYRRPSTVTASPSGKRCWPWTTSSPAFWSSRSRCDCRQDMPTGSYRRWPLPIFPRSRHFAPG